MRASYLPRNAQAFGDRLRSTSATGLLTHLRWAEGCSLLPAQGAALKIEENVHCDWYRLRHDE
jgi:hypothetical protein